MVDAPGSVLNHNCTILAVDVVDMMQKLCCVDFVTNNSSKKTPHFCLFHKRENEEVQRKKMVDAPGNILEQIFWSIVG
jgi:hypothetical protein